MSSDSLMPQEAQHILAILSTHTGPSIRDVIVIESTFYIVSSAPKTTKSKSRHHATKQKTKDLLLLYSATTMGYGLIRSVQAAVKYRGGWKGLFEHMYTVSSKYKEFVILIGPSTFYSTIEMK